MTRRGTTLIEMVVTAAILMVVAAILAPRIVTAIDSARVNRYRSSLLTLLQRAREDAISTGAPRVVAYADGSMVMRERDSETNLTEVADIEGITLSDFQVDDQTSTEGEWMVSYYPDGTADSGLFSINDAGATETVRILSRSGRLRVRLGGPEDNPTDNDRWEAGETILGG